MKKVLKSLLFLIAIGVFALTFSCNTTRSSDNKDNGEDKNNEQDQNDLDIENDSEETNDIEEPDFEKSDDDDVPEGMITKIQKGEVALNTEVTFECVITAIVYDQDKDFNNTAIKGFYVSELLTTARPYSGIYLFVRDTAEVEAFNMGDHIEITGVYKKYYGSSQIEVTTSSITKVGTADIPQPALIDDPSKVATPFVDTGSGWSPGMEHGEDSDKYQSVMIKVTDVEITNSNLGHGAFELTGNLAVDKQIHYYSRSRNVGEKFKSVTGILIYAYDAYRIAPRSDDDFVEKDDETDDESDDEDNDDDDQFKAGVIEKIRTGKIPENSDVSFEAVVTGVLYNLDDQFDPVSIRGLYVSEIIPVALPYTGIYVFVSGTAPVDEYSVGDHIGIEGKYKEFYGSSQVETNNSKITGIGTTDVPQPALIADPSKIATPFVPDGDGWKPGSIHGEDGDKYQSVLIKVEDVAITNSNLGHGNFEITGNLAIDKTIHYYTGSRTVGIEFEEVTGILIYSYSAFRLAPRSDDDLIENGGE